MIRYPNFPEKHDHESLFTPRGYVEYMRERGKYPSVAVPDGVILCYQSPLHAYILKEHRTRPADGFLSQMLLLEETRGRIGVMGNFGIGSPVAAIVLEELIAFGVKKFISIGTAGSLQKDLAIGDLVVCEKAIRDEGTSHHYLPIGKYAEPSAALTARLEASLRALGKPFRRGTSWTIDTPYRETRAEALHYQQEGVACVEMEASALFAVAKVRQVELGAMFTISDSLADLVWNPQFHSARTQSGLETLYQASVHALEGVR